MNIVVQKKIISEQIKRFWDFQISCVINLKEDFDHSEHKVLKKFQSEIEYENKGIKTDFLGN